MHLDHFGLLAPIYDRVIRTPDLRQLRALVDLTASDRLLDMGGGTGRVLVHLHNGVSAWITDASLGIDRRDRQFPPLSGPGGRGAGTTARARPWWAPGD